MIVTLIFLQPLASHVLAEVRQIIQGKFLVGHAIEHDLLVLQHFGPPLQGIRDTSQYLRWVSSEFFFDIFPHFYSEGQENFIEESCATISLQKHSNWKTRRFGGCKNYNGTLSGT